jgi:hypothetical protein
MSARAVFLLVLVAAGCGAAPAAASTPVRGVEVSAFALPVVPHDLAADEWLAQRVIDREWGPSDDSTYHVVDVPGWKSEGLALGLGTALPGAGHLYVGESSGWLYLLAESAGWAGRWIERRNATRRWDDLVTTLGDPRDSSSTFSFDRYQAATGATADELVALWSGDRNAFYRTLASDRSYLAGFSPVSGASSYDHIATLLESHDDALRRASIVDRLLVVHHVIAAIDALRAARAHNLPLRQQYQLELGERWRHGGPELRAAIVRRF